MSFWCLQIDKRFNIFLEARGEILTKISLFFWFIWRHQKDISKSTDLYFEIKLATLCTALLLVPNTSKRLIYVKSRARLQTRKLTWKKRKKGKKLSKLYSSTFFFCNTKVGIWPCWTDSNFYIILLKQMSIVTNLKEAFVALACLVPRTTDAQWSLFSLKSRTFGQIG